MPILDLDVLARARISVVADSTAETPRQEVTSPLTATAITA
jgi:hypothetical protein